MRFVGGDDGALLPWPCSCHLQLERKAEESADQHDAAKYQNALSRRCDGDGSDDVCGDQEFETEKYRAAQPPPEEIVGAVLTATLSKGHEDSEYRTTRDYGDTDRVYRRAGCLDDLDERHDVIVSPTPRLSRRHAVARRVHVSPECARPLGYLGRVLAVDGM